LKLADKVLSSVNSFVWGVPALLLILVVGIYFSFRSGFAQITSFPSALKHFMKKLRGSKAEKGVSSYQTLCTALSATVGTGNIAGVAGAIAIGGPGAVFWMWVSGVLGMIIKFAEATLAVRFQKITPDGRRIGGPMYMMEQGMGVRLRPLACVYAFFGIVAALGVGNSTQVNAVLDGFHSVLASCHLESDKRLDLMIAAALACLASLCLLGGAGRVGRVAEKLVPFAACGYIILGLLVIFIRIDRLPHAFHQVLLGAFSARSVTGGAVGSCFIALRTGISRGVFTNEAGMGTASIAYASASVEHPAEQGLMGIMEVFLDTLVICSITAFAILCSDVSIVYGLDEGAALTARGFGEVLGGWVSIPITLFLVAFAFATMLGWGLYGARCTEYLFGKKAWKIFVLCQAVVITLSAVLNTGTVWLLAEIVNGLMAIPNLIALLALSPVFFAMIKDYNSIKG